MVPLPRAGRGAERDAHIPHRQRGQLGLSVRLAGLKTRASTDRAGVAARPRRAMPTACSNSTARGDGDLAWFAYFAPYTMERHHDLVARIAPSPA